MDKKTEEKINEAADQYVFVEADHNRKWSNNDDTAGDNFGSFKAGAKWMQEQMKCEWISVKDRLPKVGEFVLVHRIEGYLSIDQYRQLHGEVKSFMYNVTHWMPLPSPPNTAS